MSRSNLAYIKDMGKLANLLLEKSYKEGHFVLASGRESDYYFDCRITSLSAQGSKLIGQIFYDMIDDLIIQEGMQIDGVAGMTMGADPLVTAVTVISANSEFPLDGMLIRKQPKDHGTSSQIEGTANLQPGAHIFMLEDVITTGGSILKACKVVEAAGYKVAAIGAILDREEGGREAIKEAGYRFFPLFTRETLKQHASLNLNIPDEIAYEE